MKILLTLSLLLNLVLMGWALTRPSVSELASEDFEEVSATEETFPKAVAEEMDEEPSIAVTPKKAPVNEVEVNEEPSSLELDAYEFGVSADKTEQERSEFLLRTLQISEEVIQKHEKLREQYNHALAKTFGQEYKEPSIAERRQLLDIEEKYLEELEKLYGKENWKKFEDFRQKYNSNGFKKQAAEKVPFIFMGL